MADSVFLDINELGWPQPTYQQNGLATFENLSSLQVGIGTQSWKADQSGIWLGGKTFSTAPFSVTMSGILRATGAVISGFIAVGGAAADVNAGIVTINGGKITAGSLTVTSAEIVSLSASKLTAGTIDASVITVTNLNADNIKSGTFKVGGGGQPNAIEITQGGSGSSGNSRLIWTPSNSRIWADSSGNIGLNSKGSGGGHGLYLYENDTQVAFFANGSQANFAGGVHSDGGFNVGDPGGSNFDSRFNGNVILGDMRLNTSNGYSRFVFKDGGGTERVSITPNGSSSHLDMNGFSLQLASNKTAIVPTSSGFRALYCVESPEVWFMDFFYPDKGIDPLFDEVTEGKSFFIKAKDGTGKTVMQVWRHRKAHADKRFEEKTVADFEANEKFLSMAKAKVV